MISPDPVITTLASTSAVTSSVYWRSRSATPSSIPTEIAAMFSVIGFTSIFPSATQRSKASARAIHAPVIEAVRVPPSAWSTSQSIRAVTAPIASMSTAARSDLPIRRWISLVRPPLIEFLPTRWGLEPGSIEYSAVIHPLPVPLIHLGTSSSRDTVHSTRVLPISIRTDPGVISVYPRVIFTSRRASLALSVLMPHLVVEISYVDPGAA